MRKFILLAFMLISLVAYSQDTKLDQYENIRSMQILDSTGKKITDFDKVYKTLMKLDSLPTGKYYLVKWTKDSKTIKCRIEIELDHSNFKSV